MTKIKSYIMKNKYTILSFIIPVAAVLIGYMVVGIYPFGEKTILISDLNGQYVDYYSALYDILKSGDYTELLYSWNMGMGSNFIGLIAYYLSSPFIFLILLFPKENIVDALLIMTLIKIGMSGFTFSIFTKYLYKESNIFIVIFSSMYALMGFNLVYSFDIMWLDATLMLPLVIIGVEEIVRKDKWVVFFTTIFITFVSNFYMSYMVGIFSFIYFIGVYLSDYSFKTNGKLFIRKFITFMKATILAVGACAILLIPTFLAIKNGGVDVVGTINMFDINDVMSKLVRFMSKFFVGAYDSLTTTKGTANIYSGIIVIILIPAFFVSKEVSKKEKIINAFIIIFLLISFIEPYTNLMWHAFDKPTGFPSRHSFLLSFVLLSISFRSLMMLIKDRDIDIKRVSIYAIGFVIIQSIILLLARYVIYPQWNYVSDISIMLTLVFIVMYFILLNIYRKNNTNRCMSILAIFMAVEMICSTSMILSSLDFELRYKDKNKYDYVNKFNENIQLIQKEDNSFYRMESDNIRTLNDSLNMNYNGIKHFSSMSNKGLNRFLNKFGFANSSFDLAMSYYGSTPISDSLFGVKYIVSSKEKPKNYTKIFAGNSNENIYLNENVLPLLYTVNKNALKLEDHYKNPFDMQNDMLNLMCGNDLDSLDYKRYFNRLEIDKVKLNNLDKIEKKNSTLYKKVNKSGKACIEFSIKEGNGKYIYLLMPPMKKTSIDILVDNKYIDSYGGYYNNTILDIKVDDSREANVKLVLNKSSVDIEDIYAYSFDQVEFNEAINKIKDNEVKNLVVNNTAVSGSIYCNDGDILFTSIPFDPGWRVYIDGKEVEVESVNDAFIGVKLDKGEHDVRFEFTPKGFIPGMIISVFTWGMLLVIFIKWKKKNKIK
ncbi:MAG: YfhO family protein [Romboutsia sp.]